MVATKFKCDWIGQPPTLANALWESLLACLTTEYNDRNKFSRLLWDSIIALGDLRAWICYTLTVIEEHCCRLMNKPQIVCPIDLTLVGGYWLVKRRDQYPKLALHSTFPSYIFYNVFDELLIMWTCKDLSKFTSHFYYPGKNLLGKIEGHSSKFINLHSSLSNGCSVHCYKDFSSMFLMYIMLRRLRLRLIRTIPQTSNLPLTGCACTNLLLVFTRSLLFIDYGITGMGCCSSR
jgi:hypothetical protein